MHAMKTAEAARRAGVNRKTIQRWIAAKEFAVKRTPKGHALIDEGEFRAWCERNRVRHDR